MAKRKNPRKASRPAIKRSRGKANKSEPFKLDRMRSQLRRITRAVDSVEGLFRNFVKANGATNLLVTPPNSERAVSPCQEHWVCYGAKTKAKNIVVTIVSKDAIKTQGCAFITDNAIKQAADAEIHKQADKDLCVPDCGADCRCLSFAFSLTFHDTETKVIYVDRTGNQNPTQPDRACRIKLDIKFDVELTIALGICVTK